MIDVTVLPANPSVGNSWDGVTLGILTDDEYAVS